MQYFFLTFSHKSFTASLISLIWYTGSTGVSVPILLSGASSALFHLPSSTLSADERLSSLNSWQGDYANSFLAHSKADAITASIGIFFCTSGGLLCQELCNSGVDLIHLYALRFLSHYTGKRPPLVAFSEENFILKFWVFCCKGSP